MLGACPLGQETGKAKRVGNTSHGKSEEGRMVAAICSSTLGHLELRVSATASTT